MKKKPAGRLYLYIVETFIIKRASGCRTTHRRGEEIKGKEVAMRASWSCSHTQGVTLYLSELKFNWFFLVKGYTSRADIKE